MKLNIRKNSPPFWEWIKDKLPDTLCAVFDSDGYGGYRGIHLKKPKEHWYDFGYLRETIAYVGYGRIEINHPNYFSDLQNLILEYEREFNTEITVELWEAV